MEILNYLMKIKNVCIARFASKIRFLSKNTCKSKRKKIDLNLSENVDIDKSFQSIRNLNDTTIWAVGMVVDIFTDILPWINNKLDRLLQDGATEVNVIVGKALANFIKENQVKEIYTEITFEEFNAMSNGVVIVASNKDGKIIDEQMIRSNNGLSSQTISVFREQPVLRIPISL